MTRPLYTIAREIAEDWPSPNYAAKPYLAAMKELNTIEDTYYADSAKSIVLYFLSNATAWRGEVARQVKAELREMVKNGSAFYPRSYSASSKRGFIATGKDRT